MSSYVPPAQQLRFGIEIELFMNLYECDEEKFKPKKWGEFAGVLSGRLSRADIDNYIDDDGGDKANYTKWTISGDGSISNGQDNRTWGIELISPVGEFGSRLWRDNLETLWRVLEQFRIEKSDSCGTHVHTSIKNQDWTPAQVISLAQAVCYFEDLVNGLVPSSRHNNAHCKINRNCDKLSGSTMPDVFRILAKCKEDSLPKSGDSSGSNNSTFEAISKLLCPHKSFRWNFTPMAKKELGTIEFRQPPGSVSEDESVAWIEFTACFVQAAIEVDHKLDPYDRPSMKRLLDFVRRGAKISGIGDTTQYIDSIFEGKMDIRPNSPPVHQITSTTSRRTHSARNMLESGNGKGKHFTHRRSGSAVTAFETLLKSNHAHTYNGKRLRKCYSNLR